MKTWLGLLVLLVGVSAAKAGDPVADLSGRLGPTPALVAVVCGEDGDGLPAVAGLVEQTPWTVLCAGGAPGELEAIRVWARDKGLLGGRVFVAEGDGRWLWLADEMADAVWVAAGAA